MRINPLRRLYIAAETWFKYSFAELNPMYHLGTLTFFFFWIILVSGIYLFVPFKGSVHGAYASVEWMTHQQWYLAGIMRSLHRYASDAAIITILLHLFRELALVRYQGTRWYSWVTGLPLLWMIIPLGITGYWLVWDQLAQYIAMGSAHLFDAIPIFFGSMASNFLPSQMSDRFFTLIMFLHLLGQPLILLFALWLHVRRLSNVNIMPPRGLAIGSFIALIILSLIKPALSHPPADLSTVPQSLNLDWFYLNIYPLLDYWTAGQVWLLTLVITLLLIFLPWFFPKRAKATAVVDLENCDGCKQCFEDCPYDAITVQARTDGKKHSHEVVVDPALCTSCGICVGGCHSANPFRKAEKILRPGIDMPDFPAHELRKRTLAAIDSMQGKHKILVFGCDHGYAVERIKTDNTRGISLYCSGMLPPTMIRFALRKGADGVLVSGCRSNDCYNRFGERWTEMRILSDRQPSLRAGVDHRHIISQGAGPIDRKALEKSVQRLRKKLIKLEPKASE
ncbi:MAG: hydrogenase iron-sulfur subunit [Xanthomonadales bacterium]|nr:hydrogenase iron-sulfur subunit [Xanthomonadales bacterium]